MIDSRYKITIINYWDYSIHLKNFIVYIYLINYHIENDLSKFYHKSELPNMPANVLRKLFIVSSPSSLLVEEEAGLLLL